MRTSSRCARMTLPMSLSAAGAGADRAPAAHPQLLAAVRLAADVVVLAAEEGRPECARMEGKGPGCVERMIINGGRRVPPPTLRPATQPADPVARLRYDQELRNAARELLSPTPTTARTPCAPSLSSVPTRRSSIRSRSCARRGGRRLPRPRGVVVAATHIEVDGGWACLAPVPQRWQPGHGMHRRQRGDRAGPAPRHDRTAPTACGRTFMAGMAGPR